MTYIVFGGLINLKIYIINCSFKNTKELISLQIKKKLASESKTLRSNISGKRETFFNFFFVIKREFNSKQEKNLINFPPPSIREESDF